MKTRISVAVLTVAMFGGVGCDDRAAQTAPAAPAAALPAGLMATAAPAEAKGVAEVRKAAADGDAVVLRGRIAGEPNPFTEGRAQFRLIDLGLKTCADMPDESCPTPWDMCCADKSEVAANSVLVQVVDAEGKPLKAELNGVNGLKPMSEVSVKGLLKKSADGKAATVDATELYVKPS